MTWNEAPAIPPATEYPPGWTHEDIKATFDRVAAQPAMRAAAHYSHSGAEWGQGLDRFRRCMQSIIAAAWEGQAAQASVEAIRRYTTDADQLTASFGVLSAQVIAAATAATATKNAIPPLIGDPPWYSPYSFLWSTQVLEGKRNDAEDEAREEMAERYVAPFAQIDSAIPVLPRPVDANRPEEGSAPQSGGGDGNHGGGSAKPGPATPGGPSDSTPGNPGPQAHSGEQTASGQSYDAPGAHSMSAVTDSVPYEPYSANTDPAAIEPTTTANPVSSSSTHPASTVGSGSSSGISSGSPLLGSLGSPGASSGGPGRTTARDRSASGVVSSPSAAATFGRGTIGSSAMMAPGAGIGRGDRDKDAQHEIPDYLINHQNTEELLGETPRMIAGGVLGAGFRAAQVRVTGEPEEQDVTDSYDN